MSANSWVYVVDTANNEVRKLNTNGVFLLKWGTDGNGEGQFNGPKGIAVDGSGAVYIADTGNHRIQKFTANGIFMAV